jgi:1L-myo-inositol 1-phosphate cytidylyltransferase
MSAHTKTALILAAGNGSRLATVSGALPKPLVELRGEPLIKHIVLAARGAGIERFVIVAGHRAEAIRSWAARQRWTGIEIELIENPHYKGKANGISVLQARHAITEPFLLLMADHIFEPETAAALLREPVGPDETILAVDRKLDNIFDMDDATKVLCKGKYIVTIGKQLAVYDAVDTGMFLCTPALFAALEHATVNSDCTLSDGMRLMAQQGKFRAFDIGNGLWQDVDTPEALAHAELIFGTQYRPNRAPVEVAHV